MTDQTMTRYKTGLEVRREVLGAEYVDRSLAAATAFSQPMQQYVTETCWSDIWTRPGLPRQTRSLVNLGMLTALGRSHELGAHVRGAVRNGCTKQEIQEVLLQTAIYCGVPAALEAFRVAGQVLEAMADETADETADGRAGDG